MRAAYFLARFTSILHGLNLYLHFLRPSQIPRSSNAHSYKLKPILLFFILIPHLSSIISLFTKLKLNLLPLPTKFYNSITSSSPYFFLNIPFSLYNILIVRLKSIISLPVNFKLAFLSSSS